MLKTIKFTEFIFLIVVFSVTPAIFLFFYPGRIVGITMIQSALMLLIVFLFLSERKDFLLSFFKQNHKAITIFYLMNLVTLARGFWIVKTSEDLKILMYSGILEMIFLPFIIIMASKREYWIYFFRFFWKYGFLMSFVLLLPINRHLNIYDFAHYSSPIYVFILLIPFIRKKYKMLIVFISILSFFSDLDVRSNLINILVSYLIMFSSYLPSLSLAKKWTASLRFMFVLLPPLLLLLALTTSFNIFKISDYVNLSAEQKNIAVDSRTGIYTDVLVSLDRNNASLYGLGAYGRTETFLTGLENHNFGDIYEGGRPGTESGMLNFYQYSGLIGVIIYYSLFVLGSYKLIYQSRNWFCVMLGCWLAFKGLFSFIEDKIVFNPNILFLCIVIGLAFNINLRSMSQIELNKKIKYIFK